ncbi:MAG: methylmalonyl-CoA mutase family protein [Acidobacteriota bacterium]
MSSPDQSPVGAFPNVDEATWRQRVEGELGSADFSVLTHRTLDGLEVQPLYTATSDPATSGSATSGPPTEFQPMPRSAGWRLGLTLSSSIPEQVQRLTASAQAHGANLLWLPAAGVSTPEGERELGGLRFDYASILEGLLETVRPETEVVLELGDEAPLCAALASAFGYVSGGCHLTCDPLATLAASGRLPGSVSGSLRRMADLAGWAASEHPEMRTVLVSVRPYHEAGASTVQELAFALATGVEYLRSLTQAGLPLADASRRLDLSFSMRSDLFSEIAKLRAARRLWAKAVACWGAGVETHELRIHAHGSLRELSRIAPRTNLLRSATQAFAAALGGADSIVLDSYDAISGSPSPDGARLALNIQHMLALEASAGRVVDPAAGSWYLEHLTDRLARAAWERFQEIERGGGMARCLEAGQIGAWVARAAKESKRASATRERPIIGSSAFVDLSQAVDWNAIAPSASVVSDDAAFQEEAFDDEARDPDEVEKSEAALTVLELSVEAPGEPGELLELSSAALRAGATLAEVYGRLTAGEQTASCEPLVGSRASADYEELRRVGDRWLAELGSRPRAALIDLGKGASDMGFVRRLLAAAGIEGFECSDIDAALEDASWNLVALCGVDARDPARVGELATRFRELGTRRIWVAHDGGDQPSAFEEAGIDAFVYEGCDVLALLRESLEALGAFG